MDLFASQLKMCIKNQTHVKMARIIDKVICETNKKNIHQSSTFCCYSKIHLYCCIMRKNAFKLGHVPLLLKSHWF